MSIEKIIRDSIESNQYIDIIHVEENFDLQDINQEYAHQIEFYIAPTGGGIYDVKILQHILDNLMPHGFEPNGRTRKFSENSQVFRFGELTYIEKIGEWHEKPTERTITIDKDLMDQKRAEKIGLKYVGGKLEMQVPANEYTGTFMRKNSVMLYPSKKVVQAVVNNIGQESLRCNKHSMAIRLLEELKRIEDGDNL